MGKLRLKLIMGRKGRILLPKKIREKLRTKAFRIVLRSDGVIELHPLI
ncbi:MAG: hypothetical protein J7L55_05830 [Desulfurococcales archaeon]|nr:hypothetical protein [Desulfurococcales archaeon]